MVGSNDTERTSSIKFLGVMSDEHISWIDHVKTVENKIAKTYCFTLSRKPASR